MLLFIKKKVKDLYRKNIVINKYHRNFTDRVVFSK